MLKFQGGFSGHIKSCSDSFKAVVIKGSVNYFDSKTGAIKVLAPGSYFSSTDDIVHKLHIPSLEKAMVYIRSDKDDKMIK